MMRAHAILAAALAVTALLAGCSEPGPEIPVFAAMDDLDADVGGAVEAALDAARAEPTAANLGALGRTYHANEFPELAARCYALAAELEPERAEWRYYLGRLAADEGDSQRAAEMFRTTTRLAPGYLPAYYHLGAALLESGDMEGAATAYEHFAQRVPERAWGWFGMARVERRRERNAEALALLEKAAALPPAVREVSFLLAETFGVLGQADRAAAEFQRFQELPDIAAPADLWMQEVAGYATGALEFLRRARDHERRGEFDRAEEYYLRVLASDPQSYAALANLGNLYKQQRRYDDAERRLGAAIEANPAQANAHALLAGVYEETGRPAEAERAALAAIERDPLAVNAHYYLGRARVAAGRAAEAVEPLERTTELAPQFVDAHFSLAVAYAESGRRDRAIAKLNDVLRMAPNHAPAREGLAQLGGVAP